MPINRWNCSFQGLGYFFSHPRLWGWASLGTLLSFGLTLAVCIKVIGATYPPIFSLWEILQSFGWGLFAFVLMVLVVFPLIFNACFSRALSNQLKREGVPFKEESWVASTLSSFWVFVRTLKWRIIWPSLLLASIFTVPFLLFPISLIAANHLAILEAVDLVLSIFGKDADQRTRWIRDHGRDCLAAALGGALLTFLLSLIFIGWLFWIPAIYCGVFLWIRNESNQ